MRIRLKNAFHDRVYEVNGTISIGRSQACDICVPHDPSVSRNHAMLRKEGKQLVVVDLNSRNGTFVADQKVETPTVVPSGAVLMVGKYGWRVETIQGEQQRAPLQPATWTEALELEDEDEREGEGRDHAITHPTRRKSLRRVG